MYDKATADALLDLKVLRADYERVRASRDRLREELEEARIANGQLIAQARAWVLEIERIRQFLRFTIKHPQIPRQIKVEGSRLLKELRGRSQSGRSTSELAE